MAMYFATVSDQNGIPRGWAYAEDESKAIEWAKEEYRKFIKANPLVFITATNVAVTEVPPPDPRFKWR